MFTTEEIQELSKIFGIVPVKKIYPVQDGFVQEGDTVWWKCVSGPEQVVISTSRGTLNNLIEHPHLYSIKKPKGYEGFIYTYEYEN